MTHRPNRYARRTAIIFTAPLAPAALALALTFVFAAPHTDAAPKKFASPVVTKKTPNHQVDIEIDIKGAKQLILQVTDGGDGTSYDWADWIEPTLIGPKGSKRLTDLQPSRIQGKVNINKNQGGGPLRVNGKPVKFGIGTHASSTIVFKLPKGFTTFRAKGGLDNGGTDQNGSRTSVQFRAFTDPGTQFANPLSVKLLPGFTIESLWKPDRGHRV